MYGIRIGRHLFHPFGRRRLIYRFTRLSDGLQLLWLFGLVALVNAAVFASGFVAFMLVS